MHFYLKLTQKCANTLTSKERCIRWSGVSKRARPDTTPALLNNKETCV